MLSKRIKYAFPVKKKIVGKNAPGFTLDFWLAGFDEKKTKRDLISRRKIGYLLVFLIEMGWSSNSQDAV